MCKQNALRQTQWDAMGPDIKSNFSDLGGNVDSLIRYERIV